MIREFQAGDMGWVICQHGEIYSNEFGFKEYFERDIVGKAQALYLNQDEFTRFWLYLHEGERAGSIIISRQAPDVAFINFVIVHPDHRSRGIARELMNAVLAHARDYKFPRVRLETFDCLKNARKLYADLGFAVVESTSEYERYGVVVQREFWELAL
ncbi:MAG: GNAT family N-acetyltransferase, partial [Gammaproteobacteria bacterium]